MVGMSGVMDEEGRTFEGKMQADSCGEFVLSKSD